ncbi:hypothetical protein [Microbacterium hominis]|uniref:hypothetical protein n=1 Tax=Microbacterium hominis TaxID=162426 RepID=UPI0037C8489D
MTSTRPGTAASSAADASGTDGTIAATSHPDGAVATSARAISRVAIARSASVAATI